MKRFFLLFVAFAALSELQAQSAANPFDLRFRQPEGMQETPQMATLANPDNPFELRVSPAPLATRQDIAAPPSAKKTSVKTAPKARKEAAPPAEQFLQIKLWFTIGILTLLTFFLTLFRGASVRSFAGFFNDNLFFQAYRDQEGRGLFPYLSLYILFPINAGALAFFALQHYGVQIFSNLWLTVGASIGIALLLIALKHLVLALMQAIFHVGPELSRYSFLIIVFGIVLGLLLTPVNMLLAFGPAQYQQWLIYGGAGMLAMAYGYRFLRGMLIANKFLLFHQFHFLLYICTVELAPVLNLVKLLTG